MLGDQLKRWAATGLGLALLTKEMAETIVQDLVKQGEISREEGKELLDSLLARAQREKDELQRRIDAEVRRVIKSLGLVPQEEVRRLEEQVQRLQVRVERLEARLHQLSAAAPDLSQEVDETAQETAEPAGHAPHGEARPDDVQAGDAPSAGAQDPKDAVEA